MVTEPPHGLSLSLNAYPGLCIQSLSLDEGEGDISIEAGVMGQVDKLIATFTEGLLDLIAPSDEGGVSGGWWMYFSSWCRYWFG